MSDRYVLSGTRKDPLVLTEEKAGNRCPPFHLRGEGEFWALRLQDNHHLPFLAERPTTQSVRRLPDFLIFSAAAPTRREPEPGLCVTVCELKSSATGAEAAKPQIRLGKLLAQYLLGIAAYSIDKLPPNAVHYCGLIVSASLPSSMIAKGPTRPGKQTTPSEWDRASGMEIFTVSPRADLWLQTLF